MSICTSVLGHACQFANTLAGFIIFLPSLIWFHKSPKIYSQAGPVLRKRPNSSNFPATWVCPDTSNLTGSVTEIWGEAGWREAIQRAWGVTSEARVSEFAVIVFHLHSLLSLGFFFPSENWGNLTRCIGKSLGINSRKSTLMFYRSMILRIIKGQNQIISAVSSALWNCTSHTSLSRLTLKTPVTTW